MEQRNTTEFFKWLAKTKCTETDIIKCRKMQAINITENENIYGISTIIVCGFLNNDVVKLGGEIKQKYDENKQQYYQRVAEILAICCDLMDAANEILVDEGAWGEGYFRTKLEEWKRKKQI